MILYHATTEVRAIPILRERTIKKNIERYYTQEENGDGYSTQGYVYLSPEVTFAIHFANCHNLVDKTSALYIFKLEIPDEMIEPDYDELRYQRARQEDIDRYGGALNCSLREYKSCRVPYDLKFNEIKCFVYKIDLNTGIDVNKLTEFAGYNLEGVIENYTQVQRKFIRRITWTAL